VGKVGRICCQTITNLHRGNGFGERIGNAKLNEDEARQIRKLALGGAFSLNEIARMFGVSKGTVLWIKKGRTWKHLWDDAPTESGKRRGVTANME
jgi:DNA invertase Pin-like site-specific DNA recombinase